MDNSSFFRDFARRLRELIAVAQTDAAKVQLAMWVDEFEQQANALEREVAANPKPAD